MPKGGKRPGAGRPKGAPAIKSQEITKDLIASGLTPLEYMLGLLRDDARDPEERKWAAEKAAPYIHPRLAAVEHSGDMTLHHEKALDELE